MANAASKHTPADREYIGSLSPHILMEFRDYLFNPTYITINAAKFLDYEWIDITLLREYVSVLGASTTRSLPILDQVHVKIEAVPPSVSTASVKAEPDVQHVASVKTRTLHVGEREVIELLSDSEPQTEDLDSDLEVIEALQPSRSSSVPPLSDADHSSKHDSDFEELDGGSDDENSDDLMLSDTVWLDDGTSQMISGRFRPSQKVTVERMEYRNGAAAVYPIHRVRTGIVVDLSDPKYHFRDASKALVPLTTVIMDADNDSWKWLGGSASANITFSPSEKAISCRSIRYECKGAHACDQLDAALRTAVRFELDDLAPRQAIVLAQQETRRTEGNTPEERVVLFINMIRKTKCNAIDSMGKPCRGGPILKPKPQGPSRGHELFVGCSGWTPKFQQGHRTHTISDNVNENLLARGLAGLPLADDVSKDTSPCSGIIHPHIGLKKKLSHAHIVNGLQVQGEIKNYPCTALRWIYVPKDSSIRQVLIIHNDLGHNHPCPALSKVTFGHKDTYRRCIQANDWWRHKEIDPWIIPCIIKSQSQIPADIWDATPSTTNTNEAQHHWTNSLTGTKLTPVEALESRRRVDQNVADEIKMPLKTGILSNSNNELSHRMARNSQRQSAVARRATESRDAANVSKDLQRRIDEEAEKRRLSNETTKFLKAQLKDAKASSSGRVSSAPARRGNIGVIFHFLQVPTPAAPVQSDYVPSAPVATSTSGEELSVDEASSHRYSSPEPTMNTWNGNLDFDSLIYDLPAINTDGNWYFLQDPSLGSFLSTYNPASDPTLFMHSNTSTTSHAYPEDPTQNFTDIYGLRGAETAMPSAASPEDPLQDLLDLYGGAGSFPGTQATHGFTVLTSTPYLDAPLPILPPPPPESPCAPSPVVQQVSEPGSSAPRSRRGRQEVDEANIIHTTRTRVPSARKRGADDDDEADVTARPPKKSKGKH
ncbi:hypothetical protein B0H10DRAFT_2195382 [Mycena sp. CBHHK59/15]|nr:hypothetical protein B0H10DRAFT_2195382 [Mycena sp. CBHHK59/15]